MLLLLFGNAGSGPAPVVPSGHPGRSRGRGRALGGFPPDDDEALRLLLEAEEADIENALTAFRQLLR